jgi:hypothetical protein
LHYAYSRRKRRLTMSLGRPARTGQVQFGCEFRPFVLLSMCSHSVAVPGSGKGAIAMTEAVLSGASPSTSNEPAPALHQQHKNPRPIHNGTVSAYSTSATALRDTPHGRAPEKTGRRVITLGIIAALLVGFSFIVAWGVAHSDWLYGTYGGIGQKHWDEITRLRAEMVRLGAAPGAIAALDDALLVPRPSTEDVVYDLQNAVLILQTDDAAAATRELTTELRALIARLHPGDAPTSTVWPAPSADLPQSHFPQE